LLEETVMKVRYFASVTVLALAVGSLGWGKDTAAPTVEEVEDAYRQSVAEWELEADTEIGKLLTTALTELRAVQDRLCRDAKLDEALAVREKIRSLRRDQPAESAATDRSAAENAAALPEEAAEIAESFENGAELVRRKLARRIETEGKGAAERLQPMFDRLCREAKLDEAVALREVMRRLEGGVSADIQPDPGYLSADASQIGQVWYFEVVGANTGTCWGTDVYTTDSSLTAAAVHSGVLKIGERGVVRVTILPGQSSYSATSRNGVMSSSWGSWGVSFKVERAYAVLRSSAVEIQLTSGSLNLTAADIGKVMYFEVVGTADSSAYGTDIYTGDSWLPTAAVHAGALKEGEKGVVRVTVLPGQEDYAATTRNGVSSFHWGSYYVSYRVERVRGRR